MDGWMYDLLELLMSTTFCDINPGFMSTLVDELWWFPETIVIGY